MSEFRMEKNRAILRARKAEKGRMKIYERL